MLRQSEQTEIFHLIESEAKKPRGPEQQEPAREVDLLQQHFSDWGNSRRLIARHGSSLRYCNSFRKWFIWDDRRWAVDEGQRAREYMHETFRVFLRQAAEARNESATKLAAGCLNTPRISNALREAQPTLAVAPDALDVNPWLLNFRNGTLDLRTMELFGHRPEDLITKLVHHDYKRDADAPHFRKFIERTFGTDLATWVQKAVGYSLTGVTVEKVIFLLWGPTNTGKTTFLELFRGLFADYATMILVDALMVPSGREDNNALADLADLRGARIAITSETEEGQRLKEGKLKRLTQGQGRIRVVRKYENPFEFPETHKLWMDTNHRPIIRGSDDSIWNRFAPVPCDNQLREDEIDRDLPSKLRSEAEGIIWWAVEGVRRWNTEQLGKPKQVDEARKKWRDEMDMITKFVAECTVEIQGAEIDATALYAAFRNWAWRRNEQVMTATMFGRQLSERGVAKKTQGRVYYQNIRLRTEG